MNPRDLDGVVSDWACNGKPDGRQMGEVAGDPIPRTLAQILANPEALKPPKAVAPRLAWESRVTLFVAREKVGKSTTARAATAKTSRGGWFLGERVERQPVLYIALEEFVGDVARQLVEFDADPENVWIMDRMAAPMADYAEQVERLRPGLVVVDTLAAFANLLTEPPQAGDSAGWTPVMNALTRPCRDTGAALLLLAHARKSDGEYRDSTAIGANVDMILTMSDGPDDNSRKVKAKGRFRLDDYTFELAGNDLRLRDAELSVEARCLTFVLSHPGCSHRAVRDGIGAAAAAVDEAVRMLLNSDSVHDHGSGNRREYYVPPACPKACLASSQHQPDLLETRPEKNRIATPQTHPRHGSRHTQPPTVSQPQTGGDGGETRYGGRDHE
jgi:hypothetical protein